MPPALSKGQSALCAEVRALCFLKDSGLHIYIFQTRFFFLLCGWSISARLDTGRQDVNRDHLGCIGISCQGFLCFDWLASLSINSPVFFNDHRGVFFLTIFSFVLFLRYPKT